MASWWKRLFGGSDPTPEPPRRMPDFYKGPSVEPYHRSSDPPPPEPYDPTPRAMPALFTAPRAMPPLISKSQDIPEGSIIFVDVETTGFHSSDRIVSIGCISLISSSSSGMKCEAIHYIFDPGKKSHPEAEKVHGYDDWTLRHQEPFSAKAQDIWDFLNSGQLIVAHNAAFDLRFLNHEFAAIGMGEITIPTYCTMEAYRDLGNGGRASLSAICETIGADRSTSFHSAIEDAFLAMQVYLWLNGAKMAAPSKAITELRALNFIEPPPRPEGPLPRRKRRHTITDVGYE